MRNLFRRPARIEAGATASINGRDMRISTVTHSWEDGFHTATVTFIDEQLAGELPVPIPYGRVRGETACDRCCVPIRADESRWSFPNSVLRGNYELLDLVMNVPGADTVVVCNTCGPQLRGTLDPRSLPARGTSTITFGSRDGGESHG